jgi:hypothetical protein
MIRSMLGEMLAHFGLQIENRDAPPPPGVKVKKVDSFGAIGTIFARDAERQQSDSVFFSDGAGPPKFYIGSGGSKLPYFRIPDHLK